MKTISTQTKIIILIIIFIIIFRIITLTNDSRRLHKGKRYAQDTQRARERERER